MEVGRLRYVPTVVCGALAEGLAFGPSEAGYVCTTRLRMLWDYCNATTIPVSDRLQLLQESKPTRSEQATIVTPAGRLLLTDPDTTLSPSL